MLDNLSDVKTVCLTCCGNLSHRWACVAAYHGQKVGKW